MASARNSLPATWSVADLLEHFGRIPAERIRLHPAPGTATEQDVIDIQAREDRLYELVDGVLVEKTMGLRESCLAGMIIRFVGNFVDQHDRGIVTAPDGMLRLAPGLVRIPDVAFISWDRLPNRQIPDEPIPDLAPNLVVEVLSEGNTEKEMQRKLRDYFFADVQLVWYVDPDKRSVQVFTAPDQCTTLNERQTLDGASVLQGFRLPLEQLFAHLSWQKGSSRKGPKRKGGKRKQ